MDVRDMNVTLKESVVDGTYRKSVFELDEATQGAPGEVIKTGLIRVQCDGPCFWHTDQEESETRIEVSCAQDAAQPDVYTTVFNNEALSLGSYLSHGQLKLNHLSFKDATSHVVDPTEYLLLEDGYFTKDTIAFCQNVECMSYTRFTGIPSVVLVADTLYYPHNTFCQVPMVVFITIQSLEPPERELLTVSLITTIVASILVVIISFFRFQRLTDITIKINGYNYDTFMLEIHCSYCYHVIHYLNGNAVKRIRSVH